MTHAPVPLGASGPAVFPLALGCMGMTPGMYGDADPDEAVATIHAALDAGVSLLDTGDFYGSGRNELLVGRALRGRRDRALVSVKFGALRDPAGGWVGIDCRPAALKNFLAMSLVRLGLDHVDVYRPGRLDPAVPIEDTMGALAELVKAGHVRHIGLSEVGADTVRRAVAVHPVVDVQIEYSLVSRRPEEALFPTLRELGVSATLYGVLSRGLLTGSRPAGAADFRSWLPRFHAGNQPLVDALAAVARERGTTPARLAIAWARARQPWAVPLVGARTRAQLADALAALDLRLDADAAARLEAALPPVEGTRYDAHQMRILDSER